VRRAHQIFLAVAFLQRAVRVLPKDDQDLRLKISRSLCFTGNATDRKVLIEVDAVDMARKRYDMVEKGRVSAFDYHRSTIFVHNRHYNMIILKI